MQKLYTCLGCGFKVFEEVFSGYEICPVCNFEDDSGVIDAVSEKLYQNDIPLLLRQKVIIQKFPINMTEISIKGKRYTRNLKWDTIDTKYLNKEKPFFPLWKYQEFLEKYGQDQYYQNLVDIAQKYNPDSLILHSHK